MLLEYPCSLLTTLSGYVYIGKQLFKVLFNLWKLHHNPEYWDEPWEFRPERFLDDDGTVVQLNHINRKRYVSSNIPEITHK